jgi:nucleotide-binding universal stress UspA family protein
MYKEILVPIDMEETELTARAVAVAEDLGRHYGASITALTAIPDFNANPMVATYFPDDAGRKAHAEMCGDLDKLVNSHFKDPKKVKCEVREGSPRKVIVRYVEDNNIDLVVIPARKTDLSKILLGSNSSYVVDRAPCSVLVIRP